MIINFEHYVEDKEFYLTTVKFYEKFRCYFIGDKCYYDPTKNEKFFDYLVTDLIKNYENLIERFDQLSNELTKAGWFLEFDGCFVVSHDTRYNVDVCSKVNFPYILLYDPIDNIYKFYINDKKYIDVLDKETNLYFYEEYDKNNLFIKQLFSISDYGARNVADLIKKICNHATYIRYVSTYKIVIWFENDDDLLLLKLLSYGDNVLSYNVLKNFGNNKKGGY